ncbi:conserved hypothetical protein [Alkaliphilus metalliredigens QYMF]|uniref:DUF4446 domain-containing protein n=1 Tax=Alkaliphilus metalliredigens (strain QYMF) TaxID=293826 RepID=A6TXD6_ALKMQ|nr:DUF4446 family protein [Alkaliphilus metalliredigens]ABR50854.1 conserved hypothetical protein [Alkaliphilus metalliredigens QYMF]
MQWVLTFVEMYGTYFILGSFLLNLLLVLLLIIYNTTTSNLKDKYKRLVKGTDGKNIESVLMQHIEKVEEAQVEVEKVHKRLDIINNRMSFCIQKVGMVRYNAFADMGSDLSYSYALLDENNNGMIITGIYGRSETVTYAKPVKDGKSNYSLSVEELQALQRAKENTIDTLELQGFRSKKELG